MEIHTVGGESVCSPESVESSMDILDLWRSTVRGLTSDATTSRPGCEATATWFRDLICM